MAKPLTSEQDAFGQAVWDHYHGTDAFEIIERSDGLFAISSGPSAYLAEPEFWVPHELEALERHAHGRVLDIDKHFVTPWFDYLMGAPEEMETLLEGTGWRIAKRYEHAGARFYTAVVERAD